MDVISTVHATWVDGEPSSLANFRSSPVTKSHGVPYFKMGNKFTEKF